MAHAWYFHLAYHLNSPAEKKQSRDSNYVSLLKTRFHSYF